MSSRTYSPSYYIKELEEMLSSLKNNIYSNRLNLSIIPEKERNMRQYKFIVGVFENNTYEIKRFCEEFKRIKDTEIQSIYCEIFYLISSNLFDFPSPDSNPTSETEKCSKNKKNNGNKCTDNNNNYNSYNYSYNNSNYNSNNNSKSSNSNSNISNDYNDYLDYNNGYGIYNSINHYKSIFKEKVITKLLEISDKIENLNEKMANASEIYEKKQIYKKINEIFTCSKPYLSLFFLFLSQILRKYVKFVEDYLKQKYTISPYQLEYSININLNPLAKRSECPTKVKYRDCLANYCSIHENVKTKNGNSLTPLRNIYFLYLLSKSLPFLEFIIELMNSVSVIFRKPSFAYMFAIKDDDISPQTSDSFLEILNDFDIFKMAYIIITRYAYMENDILEDIVKLNKIIYDFMKIFNIFVIPFFSLDIYDFLEKMEIEENIVFGINLLKYATTTIFKEEDYETDITTFFPRCFPHIVSICENINNEIICIIDHTYEKINGFKFEIDIQKYVRELTILLNKIREYLIRFIISEYYKENLYECMKNANKFHIFFSSFSIIKYYLAIVQIIYNTNKHMSDNNDGNLTKSSILFNILTYILSEINKANIKLHIKFFRHKTFYIKKMLIILVNFIIFFKSDINNFSYSLKQEIYEKMHIFETLIHNEDSNVFKLCSEIMQLLDYPCKSDDINEENKSIEELDMNDKNENKSLNSSSLLGFNQSNYNFRTSLSLNNPTTNKNLSSNVFPSNNNKLQYPLLTNRTSNDKNNNISNIPSLRLVLDEKVNFNVNQMENEVKNLKKGLLEYYDICGKLMNIQDTCKHLNTNEDNLKKCFKNSDKAKVYDIRKYNQLIKNDCPLFKNSDILLINGHIISPLDSLILYQSDNFSIEQNYSKSIYSLHFLNKEKEYEYNNLIHETVYYEIISGFSSDIAKKNFENMCGKNDNNNNDIDAAFNMNYFDFVDNWMEFLS